MTWAYINLYIFNFMDWYLSLCGALTVSFTLIISFLNLLVEIAESFSTTMLIFFFILPQITLLSALQNLTTLELFSISLVALVQVGTLRLYYNRNVRWLGC